MYVCVELRYFAVLLRVDMYVVMLVCAFVNVYSRVSVCVCVCMCAWSSDT